MPHPHLTRDEAISIHALREEGDKNCRYCIHDESNFYPRPPRGGRRHALFLRVKAPEISIHALREEGDWACTTTPTPPANFYPRPPRGGRPARVPRAIFSASISIHALREEGDSRLFCLACWNVYFYPRPPRGGRPGSLSMICFLRSFLSTPSARRATPERRIQRLQQPISIHALREEGDPHRHHLSKLAQKFLSTPSARRATCCRPPARGLSPISIHALREEGDILQTRKILARDDFYPRPPRGGRLSPFLKF